MVPPRVYTLAEVVCEYGNVCWYCGGPAETVDHVIPRAKSGGEHMGNLRPCCVIDNALKSTMLPPEFDSYRRTADYRKKYAQGYGTYRSGVRRRAQKRALDHVRKDAVRAMRTAASCGDYDGVRRAAADARQALVAARALRINWDDFGPGTTREELYAAVDEAIGRVSVAETV